MTIAATAVWLLTFLGLARRLLYVVLLAFTRPRARSLDNQAEQATIGAYQPEG